MRLKSALVRTVLQGSLLGAATLLAAPTSFAETKIGVVDSQRVVLECEDGLRVQATLKKVFDDKQRELDAKQNGLQKEREELEKARNTMKPELLQARAEKWQAEAAQVQQMFVEYNRELQRKQGELMQPILTQANAIIQRLAQTEGYALIVERQAVPYLQPELDLTDRVIKAYNDGTTAAAPIPAPAPAPGSKPAVKPAVAPKK